MAAAAVATGALAAQSQALVFSLSADLAQPVPLTIANEASSATLAFKLKTNAQARYQVRPMMGTVPAGSSFVVNVKLNRSKTPSTDELLASSDRFLVQMTAISDEEKQGALADFWKAVDKSRITSLSLACQFSQSVQAASAIYPPPAVVEPPPSQPSEGAIIAREPSTDSTTSARASVTSLAAQPAAFADPRPGAPTASKASATGEKPRSSQQSSVAEATALGQEIARLSKVIHQLKNAAPALPQELASSNTPSPSQPLTRAHVIMVTMLFLCFGLALPLLFDPLALGLTAPTPA